MQNSQAGLPIVLQQKTINKQMTYLILKGTKKQWVKLFEANDIQTKAILRYQHDKNLGIQPIYYPQADLLHENDASIPAYDGDKGQDNPNNTSGKYNLRERELLNISVYEFYGLKPKQQKKQVIEISTKTKRQTKQEQKRIKIKRQKQTKRQQNQKQNEQQDCCMVNEIENGELKSGNEHKQIQVQILQKKGEKRKKKRTMVINVQRNGIGKKKIIKKWEQGHGNKTLKKLEKEREGKQGSKGGEVSKYIQIFDGNDSELEML